MKEFNLLEEIKELKKQLSYSKNIGFFFGAGTSCALNIPNIEQLTKEIEAKLKDTELLLFQHTLKELSLTIEGRKANIEDILNFLRRIRELTCERDDKEYQGITGNAAKNLDAIICKNIYKIIFEKNVILTKHRKFLAWLNLYSREFSKEIFTTNYDLIIEKALEFNQIPYFDGFVGSYEPFFWQSSLEHTISNNDLTKNWIRLWKIHGSLSWFWKKELPQNSQKIIRIGKIDNIDKIENELVIYPSKDKYDSSRKQPFIAYFDRLRNYLIKNELLFIFTGYSFSDQHINNIIFDCLRDNNRLSARIFFFKDEEVKKLYDLNYLFPNLNVFGPTTAIINGDYGKWNFDPASLGDKESCEHYWDKEKKELILGDFNKLVDFLVISSGKNETIEKIIK